jgi:hypothetical protein
MTSRKHDTDPMPAPAALRDRTVVRDEATEPGSPPDLAVDDTSLREDILGNLSGTPRVFSPAPEQKASSDGAAFAAYQASHAVAKAHPSAAKVEDDPAVVVNVTRPDLASLVERARAAAAARDAGDAGRNATTQPKTIAAGHAQAIRDARPARVFRATLAFVVLASVASLAAMRLMASPSAQPATRQAGLVLVKAPLRSSGSQVEAASSVPTFASTSPGEPASTLPSPAALPPRVTAPAPARRASEAPGAAPSSRQASPPQAAPPHASPPSATSARPKPAEYDLLLP